MEHAGCRDKDTQKPVISAMKMFDFTESVGRNDLGILLFHEKKTPEEQQTISRRMLKIIRSLRTKFVYMLVDVPGIITLTLTL